MTHTDFFNQIKQGSVKNVYLFHGEEEYIKEEAGKALKNMLVPDFQDLNISTFDAGTASEIIAACDACPFMADKRLVIVRFIPKEKDAKTLCDYLDKVPQDTVLLFDIKGKADAKTTLVKKLKSMEAEVLFDYLKDADAVKWIIQHAHSSGAVIDQPDALYMYNLVGKDMMSIKNELSKLCDYVGEGGIITKEVISFVVIKNLEFQLYNAYSFFMNGKMQDGFRSIEAIMSGKDRESESMGIAGYFLSCLKATLVCYDLLARGASQSEMEKQTGKKGYQLKDLSSNAKKFTREELLDGITLFCDVARLKITAGQSSYNALIDAIIKTFSKMKK